MNRYLEETGDAVGHVGLSSGERLMCGTPQSAGSHGHVGLSSGERPRCGTPRSAGSHRSLLGDCLSLLLLLQQNTTD